MAGTARAAAIGGARPLIVGDEVPFDAVIGTASMMMNMGSIPASSVGGLGPVLTGPELDFGALLAESVLDGIAVPHELVRNDNEVAGRAKGLSMMLSVASLTGNSLAFMQGANGNFGTGNGGFGGVDLEAAMVEIAAFAGHTESSDAASSMILSVSRLSISPTPATIAA